MPDGLPNAESLETPGPATGHPVSRLYYKKQPMIEDLLQPRHLLVILAIAILMFGPKKLPELGKSLAEGIRGFKDSLKAPEPTDTNKA